MALLRIIPTFFAVLATTFFAVAAHAQTLSPLAGKVFGSGNRNLVVVLHGDVSGGGAADYMYALAASIASAKAGTTAVALLRPGYYDRGGQKSKGSNNNRSDHYTSANNALVAQTIQNLKSQLKPNRVSVIGHSGGAAQLGVIIGRYPDLIDVAVLASCPCDINAWRISRGKSSWPASQSPTKFLAKVSKRTKIILVNGTGDTNTRPLLAQNYMKQAQSLGLQASYVPVSGASHNLSSSYSAKLREIATRELK